MELNSFYDKVQADDPEIDVFAAGWSTGLIQTHQDYLVKQHN